MYSNRIFCVTCLLLAAITFPGAGDKHNTVINLPEFKDVPQRNSKLVIDVKGNPSMANISDHINNVSDVRQTLPDCGL
jgi:hypothetical protein